MIEKYPRSHLATVKGPCRFVLLGERVALNILARCSGVATAARSLKTRIEALRPGMILAGTRKTTPGFRLVEKYAMSVGGCDTHRMDLSSMIMLKDNHIQASGSIGSAVRAAKKVGGFSLKVDVECSDADQADEAIEADADVVMLDNLEPCDAERISKALRDKWRGKRSFLLEISGGLTPSNIGNYVLPSIDILSSSCIHQGVPHVDFSLKVQKSKA